MKKKQIISLILALVITSLFLTMTSFAEARSQGGFTAKCGAPCGCLNQEGYPAGRSSGYPDWENKRWGIMNLDLSQEQIAEINQIKLEFQKTSLELKKEIGIKRLEVKELMMEDPVDLEKVKAKWEEIAQLQVELKIKSLENQQKIKEVLTPEQLAKCPMRFPRFRFR
jgi:Spy/CpxP family protein refolding chaperone